MYSGITPPWGSRRSWTSWKAGKEHSAGQVRISSSGTWPERYCQNDGSGILWNCNYWSQELRVLFAIVKRFTCFMILWYFMILKRFANFAGSKFSRSFKFIRRMELITTLIVGSLPHNCVRMWLAQLVNWNTAKQPAVDVLMGLVPETKGTPAPNSYFMLFQSGHNIYLSNHRI